MTLEELLCVQTGWRWCHKCLGLFFAGTDPLLANTGPCSAGAFHDDTGSGEYTLMHQVVGLGQPGWHWCKKCQGQFFAGTDPLLANTGRCSAGAFHDDTGSGEYTLMHKVVGLVSLDGTGAGSAMDFSLREPIRCWQMRVVVPQVASTMIPIVAIIASSIGCRASGRGGIGQLLHPLRPIVRWRLLRARNTLSISRADRRIKPCARSRTITWCCEVVAV